VRFIKKILAITATVIIASCASTKDLSLKVSPGDPKDHVLRFMGTPDDRQFKGKVEAWQYGMVVSIGVCDYTVIWFESGQVIGLNSYRNFSTMGCRSGLKSINWEDAPDKIIEIRER
jgi:hypothetical protein